MNPTNCVAYFESDISLLNSNDASKCMLLFMTFKECISSDSQDPLGTNSLLPKLRN